MAKTILKLHANGDFETVDTPLTQSDVAGNYKFAENAITVPKIIEYPPVGYRNYFIEKTSVSGYVDHYGNGILQPQTQYERTSDFIDVTGWGNGVMRAKFENLDGSYQAWASIIFYDSAKQYVGWAYDDYVTTPGAFEYVFEHAFSPFTAYIRISTNYYDHPTANVKISVEKGTVASNKHYLALEDIPTWAKETGNLISFFNEGIVIKGELIQTNS